MHTKPYLIVFHTKKSTVGYAVVNAQNPGQAMALLKRQGRFQEEGYHIETCEELWSPCSDLMIVTEGVLTKEYNAFEIARKHGYKGTEEQWLESFKKDYSK